MNPNLSDAFNDLPLVAILRGIQPDEVIAVADVLMDCGFRFIEVPLNSPEPWDSIARLRAHCPDTVLVGAGTVLTVNDTQQLDILGADLLVTPNTNPDVIAEGQRQQLASFIGFMTPTEAFSAIAAGAQALKLFPSTRLGVDYFKDIKAVLPSDVPVLAVGGIDHTNMAQWHTAGIGGFGFGSNLYKPGKSLEEIRQSAQQLVDVWRALAGNP